MNATTDHAVTAAAGTEQQQKQQQQTGLLQAVSKALGLEKRQMNGL